MKRSVLRNVSAVFVVAAILFTTVFSLSVITAKKADAASFTPRLTAPESNNKYYYDDDYNIFQYAGYGLPNCTAYAYGRAYEILGTEPKLSWGSAGLWFDYNASNHYYNYGSTPKVGAIACWNYGGSGGHVAVVEKIDSNGNMTLSNSEWGGRTFYLTYAKATDSNPGGNSWWTFEGYIYLLDSADVVEPTVTSKTGVYKTDAQPYLNMRSGAGLDKSIVQPVYEGINLTVTEITVADGLEWGKTTYNGKTGWVALKYCIYVSAIPEPTVATTAAPTTAAPTTVEPTTVPPTTVAPTFERQDTTEVPYAQDKLIGDVNGDGRVTILDATLIQKYLADVITLKKEQIMCCDFDFNGRVSVNDVTSLQRYLIFND